MAKKLFVLVLLIGVVLTFITIGRSFFAQIACEGQPINNNVDPTPSQQIFGNRIIGQTFLSPWDGLNQINILFQTYQRQNNHEVVLRLLEVPSHLNNPLEGVEVYRTNFKATTTRSQFWHTFNFPPITDSAQKTYILTLESPESTDGDALTVGGIERDAYLNGSAFLTYVPIPGDITFRVCYEMSLNQKLAILAEQITQNRPGLWGQAIFYIASLLIYALLLIYFFKRLAQIEV